MQHYDFEENDKISDEVFTEGNNTLDQASLIRDRQLTLRRKVEELLEEKRLRLELDGYDDCFSQNRLKDSEDNFNNL